MWLAHTEPSTFFRAVSDHTVFFTESCDSFCLFILEVNMHTQQSLLSFFQGTGLSQILGSAGGLPWAASGRAGCGGWGAAPKAGVSAGVISADSQPVKDSGLLHLAAKITSM